MGEVIIKAMVKAMMGAVAARLDGILFEIVSIAHWHQITLNWL